MSFWPWLHFFLLRKKGERCDFASQNRRKIVRCILMIYFLISIYVPSGFHSSTKCFETVDSRIPFNIEVYSPTVVVIEYTGLGQVRLYFGIAVTLHI